MISAQEVRDGRDNIKSQIDVLESEVKDRKVQIKTLKGSLDSSEFNKLVSEIHNVVCGFPACRIGNLDYRCSTIEKWREKVEKLIALFSTPDATKVVQDEGKPRSKRKLQFDDDSAPVV